MKNIRKNVTKILQIIKLNYKFLKKLDILIKKYKIIVSKIIGIGKKGEIKNERFKWRDNTTM